MLILALILTAQANPKNSLLQSQGSEIYHGFLDGIQVDPSNPSNCVKSYSQVALAISGVLETFKSLDVHTAFNLVKNLNTLINSFVSSYDICNYLSISSKYLVDTETTLLNILINVTKNIQQFLSSLNYLFMAISYKDSYGIGFYLGQVIQFGMGITL